MANSQSAQHTPGPWTFSRWDPFGDARFYVAQAEGAPYTPGYSDVATLVAETCSGERVAIQEANAHLIAAAPDLLEALQGIVKWADVSRDTFRFSADEESDSVRRIYTAIAKATGSAS